jgi:hypothetical protein
LVSAELAAQVQYGVWRLEPLARHGDQFVERGMISQELRRDAFDHPADERLRKCFAQSA